MNCRTGRFQTVTYRKGRFQATTCWRIVAIPTRRFSGVGQTTTVPHPARKQLRANNARTQNTSRGGVESVDQYQKINATLVIAQNTRKRTARLDPRLGGAANEWPGGWSICITSRWQNWMTRPPHQLARSLGQNQYGGLPRHRHCHGPQNLPSNLYQRLLFCLWERVPPRRNAVIPPPVRRPQGRQTTTTATSATFRRFPSRRPDRRWREYAESRTFKNPLS